MNNKLKNIFLIYISIILIYYRKKKDFSYQNESLISL